VSEPITLREAGPTERALHAVQALEDHGLLYGGAGDSNFIAHVIDREAGIKDLIGLHNDLVQRYEDEHELRLRLGVDLRLAREERAMAHAILHTPTCLCAQSLDSICQEVLAALNTLKAELVGEDK
jgi:hypothetical protein